ncbi:hypothetical protein HY439_01595 [Candidatus Microgenomates bacterium]|nr:hypothetical protein [Candidatus Microgenomates bacterium]
MKIILLTGVPGTGKTRIGNHLKDTHDFYHIDLEDPGINSSPEFIQFHQTSLNPDQLMQEINIHGKDAVITWGFYPIAHDFLLLRLQHLGAKMFWLDGDRNLAKEAWRNRTARIPDELFDKQIERINNHNIKGIFKPFNINTFDEVNKAHRDIEEIIKEIFENYDSQKS